MNVIDPTLTTHIVEFVPRFEPTGRLSIVLTNEFTSINTAPINDYYINNRNISISFDHKFEEGDSYQIAINEGIKVVYRGLLYATEQETQDFQLTKDKYYF